MRYDSSAKVEPHGFAAIWNLEKKIIKPLALRINTRELTYDPSTATPMKTYPKTKENRISTN